MGDLAAELLRSHPELEPLLQAATEPLYIVGGAVRDQLLGRPRADVDLVVEGDAAALAQRVGGAGSEHERFGTARVAVGGHEVDIASARREFYPEAGALPVVETGASIEEDLGRRDFTINAMAVPLQGDAQILDPHGGRGDLERRQLRVLQSRSFVDDPTRAIRAARYAARFDLNLEPETERLLRDADLATVSAERRRAELQRLAAEPTGVKGLVLLERWGLVGLREGGIELAAKAAALLDGEPWRGTVDRADAVLAAALGPPGPEVDLAERDPGRPSDAVDLARPARPVELLLARALGAEWLDRYLDEWSKVALEIDGADLIAAGIPQGPALGRGLDAARRAKLDGGVSGHEQELEVALEAARRG